MKPKKTVKASLEPKRKRFFVIGTTIALATTLAAFEWGVPIQNFSGEGRKTGTPFIIEDLPPITFVDKPIEQPQKIEQPNSDQIEIVDELDEIEIEIPQDEVPEIEIAEGTDIIFEEPDVEEKVSIVYDYVDAFPTFECTSDAAQSEREIFKYLSSRLVYPYKAKQAGIEGTVYLQFVIDRNGRMKDLEVLRGVDGGCTEEAVRVVKSMEEWCPGKNQGIPVNVRYKLPIKFKLK